jgi:hypothetical protein
LCSACHRHFRARDAVCPFCGASTASALAPRAVTGLVPGASRSRRYAASAAFLAGSALFACGETANDGDANNAGTGGEQSQVTGGAGSGQGGSKANQGGSKSNQGGSAAGSGGATAGAGGDDTGGAVSSGGTMQSTGGATGSGGAAAGGSATKATGRACEGFSDRSGCHSVDECSSQPAGIGSVSCVLVEPPRSCGNPQFQPRCPEEGCGDGQVCIQQTCGSLCMPACTETSCAAGNECVDGQCRPLPCSETQVPCPDGFECDFEATGPGNHCVPVHCETGDYECQPWQDCAQRPGVDGHGCAPHECVADADCGACGYCVNRQCAPQLGICYQMIAMPYGCVWPDEELM